MNQTEIEHLSQLIGELYELIYPDFTKSANPHVVDKIFEIQDILNKHLEW